MRMRTRVAVAASGAIMATTLGACVPPVVSKPPAPAQDYTACVMQSRSTLDALIRDPFVPVSAAEHSKYIRVIQGAKSVYDINLHALGSPILAHQKAMTYIDAACRNFKG